MKVYEELKFENPDGGAWKQGWRVTYPEGKWNSDNLLHVFVLPHSHTDPGKGLNSCHTDLCKELNSCHTDPGKGRYTCYIHLGKGHNSCHTDTDKGCNSCHICPVKGTQI